MKILVVMVLTVVLAGQAFYVQALTNEDYKEITKQTKEVINENQKKHKEVCSEAVKSMKKEMKEFKKDLKAGNITKQEFMEKALNSYTKHSNAIDDSYDDVKDAMDENYNELVKEFPPIGDDDGDPDIDFYNDLFFWVEGPVQKFLRKQRDLGYKSNEKLGKLIGWKTFKEALTGNSGKYTKYNNFDNTANVQTGKAVPPDDPWLLGIVNHFANTKKGVDAFTIWERSIIYGLTDSKGEPPTQVNVYPDPTYIKPAADNKLSITPTASESGDGWQSPLWDPDKYSGNSGNFVVEVSGEDGGPYYSSFSAWAYNGTTEEDWALIEALKVPISNIVNRETKVVFDEMEEIQSQTTSAFKEAADFSHISINVINKYHKQAVETIDNSAKKVTKEVSQILTDNGLQATPETVAYGDGAVGNYNAFLEAVYDNYFSTYEKYYSKLAKKSGKSGDFVNYELYPTRVAKALPRYGWVENAAPDSARAIEIDNITLPSMSVFVVGKVGDFPCIGDRSSKADAPDAPVVSVYNSNKELLAQHQSEWDTWNAGDISHGWYAEFTVTVNHGYFKAEVNGYESPLKKFRAPYGN